MCTRSIPSCATRRLVPSVRVVHPHAPLGWSCCFGGVQSIPVRPWDPRGSSHAFGPIPYAVEVVVVAFVRLVHFRAPWGESGSFRSIPVRPWGRQVRSVAFGPFPCAVGVVGFVRVL